MPPLHPPPPRAGKYMLAHAASAQGISAVENMCGRPHVLNHLSVPAACFTHPEVRRSGGQQGTLHLQDICVAAVLVLHD